MKSSIPILLASLVALAGISALGGLFFAPMPWYGWVLAASALPFVVGVSLAFTMVAHRQPRIYLSTRDKQLPLTDGTTAAEIQRFLGDWVRENWDDDTEHCLVVPMTPITLTISCDSSRRGRGKLHFIDIELAFDDAPETPGGMELQGDGDEGLAGQA